MNEITGVTKTQTKTGRASPCRSGLDKPYRKKSVSGTIGGKKK